MNRFTNIADTAHANSISFAQIHYFQSKAHALRSRALREMFAKFAARMSQLIRGRQKWPGLKLFTKLDEVQKFTPYHQVMVDGLTRQVVSRFKQAGSSDPEKYKPSNILLLFII